jgi:hypothetical protein
MRAKYYSRNLISKAEREGKERRRRRRRRRRQPKLGCHGCSQLLNRKKH